MYILNHRLVNPQKGDEVDFYLFDGERPIIKRVHVPDIYFSKRLTKAEADGLFSEAQSRLTSLSISPEIVESGNRYVVRFTGPRGLKKSRLDSGSRDVLGKFYSNPDKTVGYRFEPYSRVEIGQDGSLKVTGRISPEELLRLGVLGFDIEVEDYDTPHPNMYLTSVVSGNESAVFTTREKGRDTITIDGITAPVLRFPNQVDLAIADRDFMARKVREGEVIVTAYNLGYDASRKAAILKRKGGFAIDIDGSRLRMEGGIPGFIKKWVGNAVIPIDPYAAAINLLGFLPNRKLATVSTFTNLRRKTSPGDLKVLAEDSKVSDERADEGAVYNLNDSAIPKLLVEYLMPLATRMATDFHTDLPTVFFRSTPVEDYYDVEHYKSLKVPRYSRRVVKKVDKNGEPKGFEVDLGDEKGRLLELDTTRGPVDVVVGYIPLIKDSLAAYLRPRFPNVFNYHGEDALTRILGLMATEKAAIELLRDYHNTNVPDNVFFGRHGMTKQTLESMLEAGARKYKHLGEYVVNNGWPFTIFNETGRDYESDGVAVLDRGHALSVSPDRFVVKLDGNQIPIAVGVDIYGTKGDKTDFERELIGMLLDCGLNGRESEGLAELRQARTDLANGRIDRSKLVYYTAIDDDGNGIPWFARAYRARNRRRTKVIRQYKMMPGDSRITGYVLIDGGPQIANEEEFLSGNNPVAVDEYGKKLDEGTVGELEKTLKAVPVKQLTLI